MVVGELAGEVTVDDVTIVFPLVVRVEEITLV